ncbi:MAG TPA: hypothetical protein VGA69_01725 [Nitriliruptorales bacterium]
MRHPLAILAVIVLPLTLGACGDAVESVQEGVDQATRQAGEAIQIAEFCRAALDVANAVDDQDWDRAIERGEVMAAEAPDDIRGDTQTVLEGAKRIRDGDTAAAQDEEFQAAAQRVRDYARDRCDPTS